MSEASESKPRKKKGVAFAVAAVVALLLGAAGVAIAVDDSGDKPATTADSTPAATTDPTPSPEPSATAAATEPSETPEPTVDPNPGDETPAEVEGGVLYPSEG